MMTTKIEKEILLPIDSVVRFKNWEQIVMIYGRKQLDSRTKEERDYVACYYPIGNISTEYNLFFNHEHVSEIVFIGYINDEENKLSEDFKK
ncbi:DUF4176 domain-containing protein [Bacillus paranthracis]|uniref:DUF4176 domain-containing protein n=1 Tax=Bacillus paranthracis TaxID=2026186 RepID=UPI000B44EEE2|nr:DUF4176 domain-containing protein [Bacillus paranthracis]MDA1583661.1 DUF4176 domain-containing protein [Bacillus cereus group sp. TH230-1LC]MRC72057.1 DUF4176 domain-containing protein [Bacillus thuringiensis]OTX69363.1 hypothetical protein BK722_17835 [Bacillus thuringiensis serovar finitimus]MCR6797222.1 DUF4176 domain-containing protein [Bacillus paranthracis]MEC3356004.1 DUF4176 domain-containing protein [Bacillus paranthracis]